MTILEADRQLFSNLLTIYDKREASAITDLVMENITGWKKIDRIIHKQTTISPDAVASFKKYMDELLHHKPVQYVLHEAWFAGMKFYVDEHVLIPRPETEELTEWLISEIKMDSRQSNPLILDVGTGSGCIPISLKKKLPGATIISCDISKPALEVARLNARAQKADIDLREIDFLDPGSRASLPSVDYIISNPPYIPEKDKGTLEKNVGLYEPHLALFTEDGDPLVFYSAIAVFAKQKLSPKGKIFAELHEELSDEARQLFIKHGFDPVEIKKDMQGKNRMIKATMLL